jgi:hypothetical protein
VAFAGGIISSCVACEPVYQVSGQVVTSGGTGAADVAIRLACPQGPNDSDVTDADGGYAIFGMGCMSRDCSVVAAVDGGPSLSQSIDAGCRTGFTFFGSPCSADACGRAVLNFTLP